MTSIWTAEPTAVDAAGSSTEAEETLRAIGGGEVDAFVVSDGTPGARVFMLSTADRPYRMFVDNMRDGAATISSTGILLYANRSLAELLGCSRDSLVGTPLTRYVAGGMSSAVEALHGPDRTGTSFELELLDDDANHIPVLVGTSPLEVDGEQLICITFADLRDHLAQVREIARLSRTQAARMVELQGAQAALTQQATHDALTGLPNRGLLLDRLHQTLAQAERSGHCTATLFLDLDRFKQVNDTRGHAAGDAVLSNVGRVLVAALRPMDTVARIGGDEFVVLAPNVGTPIRAMEMAMRLIAAIDGAQRADRVGVSIGISISEAGRGDAETLLKEADTAMYKAKSAGGGHAELFDAALDRSVRERSNALKVLRSALEDRRVVVHYQPIVDVSSGNVSAFEALARITTRRGSILPPSAFIPVAEESGLVIPLGTQVLNQACVQAHAWPAPQSGGKAVAVNLSARQFEPGNLAAIIKAGLEASGLDPQCLHLELTETALIGVDPEILQQLGRIRDLGVEVGLDDFGTGYASLTHLRRLPVTFVKIDQTFLQPLGADGDDDDRIVSSVIDLAANLGLRSIAEGIETTEQLDRLRDLGCDQAQGYLFARPLASDAIMASRN